MIFVDTGYFIARADPNDSLHDRSMRWDVEISDRLLVTEYVICEVVNYFSALSERRRGHLIVDLVRISSAYQIINAATEWFDRGLRLHRARLDK